MIKSKKSDFKKSYMIEFDASGQTFDRRRDTDFKSFNNAERKWASSYLGLSIDELTF